MSDARSNDRRRLRCGRRLLRPLWTGRRRAGTIGGIAVILAAGCLGGCGGGGSSPPVTTAASVPRSWSVLESPVQDVTFHDVELAIANLYRRHPDIEAFVVRYVQYNPTTRDKVLQVCRRGGPESDPAAFEAARIAACAPLIFFFYSYGRESSVAASLDVARKLYWYAVTSIRGPFDAGKALSSLLGTWGVT